MPRAERVVFLLFCDYAIEERGESATIILLFFGMPASRCERRSQEIWWAVYQG